MTKRNIITAIIATTMLVTCLTFSAPAALAQSNEQDPPPECGGVQTSIIRCGEDRSGQDVILDIVRMAIRIMTAGVGIAAVAAVVVGAILYSSSEGSPDKIKKARDIWTNTVIGLLLFAFLVSITNFIIPGGVF